MDTTFEMFDYNVAFEIILGKPWLQTVKVVHCFEFITIRISAANKATMIRNDNLLAEKEESKGKQEDDRMDIVEEKKVRVTTEREEERKQSRKERWFRKVVGEESEEEG
ncbi:hypothetical protein M422DRAFT_247988 [Sphaerobolus stellatus SS14]|nr:hypothetical protein M422DRAFT_247988 [Sphaerobolus stellatus SS14]